MKMPHPHPRKAGNIHTARDIQSLGEQGHGRIGWRGGRISLSLLTVGDAEKIKPLVCERAT